MTDRTSLVVAPVGRSPVAGLVGPAVLFGLLVGLLAGCVDDSATPIDPAQPAVTVDFTDVTHTMEPTDQMRDAAEQQCRDDADLVEGYIKAVDPDSGDTMAEISVDCAEVRG